MPPRRWKACCSRPSARPEAMGAEGSETDRVSDFPNWFLGYLSRYEGAAKEREVEAYLAIISAARSTKSPSLKAFMIDFAEYFCTGTSMSLSQARDELLPMEIREFKIRNKDLRNINVLRVLEECVSRCTDSSKYTTHSKRYRKKLTIPGNFSQSKTYNSVPDDISGDRFLRSRYDFGSHAFYIVEALQLALTTLEKRYSIDFDEMERNLTPKKVK